MNGVSLCFLSSESENEIMVNWLLFVAYTQFPYAFSQPDHDSAASNKRVEKRPAS